MQDLIKKVHELYDSLIVRDKKLTGDKQKVAVAQDLLDKAKAENVERTKELDEREAPIKKIEDVIKLKAEAADAYKKLVSEKKMLKKEQAEFEEHEKKTRAELKSEAEHNSSKKLKLQKAEKELDEKKTKYKIEVMANVNKLLAEKGIKL